MLSVVRIVTSIAPSCLSVKKVECASYNPCEGLVGPPGVGWCRAGHDGAELRGVHCDLPCLPHRAYSCSTTAKRYGPFALNCRSSFFLNSVKVVCQHSLVAPSLTTY